MTTPVLAVARLPRLRTEDVRVTRNRWLSEVFASTSYATCTFVLLFLATGLVGVWASYDGTAALMRFLLLVIGIGPLILLPLIFSSTSPVRMAFVTGWLAALGLMGMAALYAPAKLGIDAVTAALPDLALNDNLVGGVAAAFLPLVLALLAVAIQQRRWLALVVALGGIAAAAAVLYFSDSRGALIGLGSGLFVGLYMLWRLRYSHATLLMRITDLVFVLFLLVVLLTYLATVLSPVVDAQVGASAAGGSAYSRIALWRDTLPILQDYWFTGAGMGVTPMVLSTYAFMVHVPYLTHAHNLYLQIGLEQGIFGLIAFLGVAGSVLVGAIGVWRMADRPARLALAGSVAAVVAVLMHGFFDAEIYASVWLPLVLWPFCIVFHLTWLVAHNSGITASKSRKSRILGATVALLIMLVPLLLRPWNAALMANLGAIAQNKSQLAAYATGEWRLQDHILRERPDLLAPAEELYKRALQIAPMNATANRRLGQIALARGDVEAASGYLETAWLSRVNARLTRQLLGEVRALQGDIAAAVSLWQGLDNSQGQLMVRGWWYEQLGDQPGVAEQRARFDRAVRAYTRQQAGQ